ELRIDREGGPLVAGRHSKLMWKPCRRKGTSGSSEVFVDTGIRRDPHAYEFIARQRSRRDADITIAGEGNLRTSDADCSRSGRSLRNEGQGLLHALSMNGPGERGTIREENTFQSHSADAAAARPRRSHPRSSVRDSQSCRNRWTQLIQCHLSLRDAHGAQIVLLRTYV